MSDTSGSSTDSYIDSTDALELPPVTTSGDDQSRGVGLSDPQLSAGRRKMLDMVNRLHSTGVQIDIDLPVIAVIGSQSAGKSSLIESISGITLPRASGTCTRCPTECRLSYSEAPWKCVVSIRFITDPSGAPLGQAKSERFGAPIFDKAEVEERIRRAQRAILNPRSPVQSFLVGDDEDTEDRQLTFSKNCVCLEISGQDVADLSFVDLPGIIAHEGSSGKPGDVALVESLVETYIVKPSCLILLTVSCETDFENQGAFRLAQAHDAEGKRTIGVLTKPDRIPEGEEDEWLRFIKNQRVPLTNGWFSVKQPDSKALKAGITWAQAREMEDNFFSTQMPWSSLEIDYQRRLRTKNLTTCLSQILSELITRRLPEIQHELQGILQKTDAELLKLPKPPSSDPVGEVHQLLAAFSRDVSTHVKGTATPGLIQHVNELHTTFRQAIRATAPDFRPYEEKMEDPPDMPKPDFLGAEDPALLEDVESEPIYISEVCDLLEKARTRELPGHYPFAVIQYLVGKIIEKWALPAYAFSDDVHHITAEFMSQVIAEHFAEYATGGLQQHVTVIVVEHIRKCAEEARGRIKWLLSLEDSPFTLNEHYYGDYKEKFHRHYKSVFDTTNTEGVGANFHTFKADEAEEDLKKAMSDILSGLASFNMSNVAPADLAKLLPPNPRESAINVMAEVRAYYQVAYKRFSDNVPLAVDREVLRGLDSGIGLALFKGLGLGGDNGPQKCCELLQEPPNTVARRTELQKKRDRLSTAKRELMTMSMF